MLLVGLTTASIILLSRVYDDHRLLVTSRSSSVLVFDKVVQGNSGGKGKREGHSGGQQQQQSSLIEGFVHEHNAVGVEIRGFATIPEILQRFRRAAGEEQGDVNWERDSTHKHTHTHSR